MVGYELQLAAQAPHDLIMLDATLTLPVIYLNQALSKSNEVRDLACSEKFQSQVVPYLRAYKEILKATRSDKNFVGVPKYSTRREIGSRLGWSAQHDDRALLTLLLDPGELTKPLPLEQPEQAWHLGTASLRDANDRPAAEALAEEIAGALAVVNVIYYKPHQWLPALRLEFAAPIAQNQYRLASVIQGTKHQCATPGMLEPYPLYLADRMVKALSKAVPAFRHITTQRIAERYAGDIGEVFFSMHGYRSESGV
jgi:hypothetical protein